MTKRKEVCTMMPSSADVGGFLIKGGENLCEIMN